MKPAVSRPKENMITVALTGNTKTGGTMKSNGTGDAHPCADSFAQFVVENRQSLRRALVAHHGPDAGTEALADAFAYAWQHWERVATLANPVGYVFRVGDRLGVKASVRQRREPSIDTGDERSQQGHPPPWFDSDVAPELAELLATLPARQRTAVLLIHAYGYTYRETAELLDVPLTTATNDVIRGMKALRKIGRTA
jgi:DNA-directed RNA polymerase specialized sigma24 family protein